MRITRRRFTLDALALVASAPLPAAIKQACLKILVVDGINNHTWRVATAAVCEILENSSLFSVEVSITPSAEDKPSAWDNWRPNFFRFDAVIVNFNSGYDAKALLWPGTGAPGVREVRKRRRRDG